MKRSIAILMAMVLALAMLAGCSGQASTAPTTAPAEATKGTDAPASNDAAAPVKTGLYIAGSVAESKGATGEEEGQAKYDVTLIAVTVTDAGVIESCVIDSVGTAVKFDASGAITSDLSAAVATKNELGEGYGMKKYAGSKYEWNEQAAAVAAYAVGKTAQELREGAVDETGHAADADLASTATIYIGSFVDGIIAAAENAQHLGAASGDKLVLASMNSVSGSKAPEGEKDGTAQLDVDVTALTMNGDIITSCYIDSLQAKVKFDATGSLTSDLTAALQTKNELGEGYGLKAYAGSKYEWNEQAAAFAAYVTGKTAAEVAGIAVNEKTAPADADLAATVTISIAGFQALIAKACA